MIKLLVSLYSTYLDAYDDPTVSVHREEDLKDLYLRTIYSDPEGAYKARAHEKAVVVLGTFNDCTGQLIVHEKPVKLFDMASLFPKGWLAQKEAKNNG